MSKLTRCGHLFILLFSLFSLSCRSSLNEKSNSIAQTCAWDKDLVIQNIESQSFVKFEHPLLDNADKLQSKVYDPYSKQFVGLEVSAGGCIHFDKKASRFVYAQLGESNWRARLKTEDIAVGELRNVRLEDQENPRLQLVCPRLSDGNFALEQALRKDDRLNGYLISSFLSPMDRSDQSELKSAFIDDTSDAGALFQSEIQKSGSYFLGYKLESAFDSFEDPVACQFRVIREEPELIFEETRKNTYIVGTSSRVPLRASEGSQLSYCFAKVNDPAQQEICRNSDALFFQEAGHYEVTIKAVNPVGKSSASTTLMIEVDAEAPRVVAKWKDDDLNQPLAGPRLPQRNFEVKIESDDDIASSADLRATQTCRVKFYHGNGQIQPGDFARCTAGECQNRSLNEAVPCKESFQFQIISYPMLASPEVSGILAVEVAVEDKLQHRSSFEVQTILDSRNFPLWTAVKSEGAEGNPPVAMTNVRKLLETRQARLWAMTPTEVFVKNEGHFVPVDLKLEASPLPGELPRKYELHTIQEAPDGSIYIGWTEGLLRIDSGMNVSRIDGSQFALKSPAAEALTFTEDGLILVGNRTGLSRYQPQTQTWSPTAINGLDSPENPIHPAKAMLAQDDGTIAMFFGRSGLSLNGGTLSYGEYPVSEYYKTMRDGQLNIQVESQEKVWVLGAYTLKSLNTKTSKFHDEGWDKFLFPDFTELVDIATDANGHRWLLSTTAVYYFPDKNRPKEWVRYDINEIDPTVNRSYFYDLLVDQQGKIWIAGSAGVFQLKGSFGKFLAVPLETANSRFMADVYFLKEGPDQGDAFEYFKGIGLDGMHRLKLDDRGQLWGLSQKAMLRLDGMRWVPESLPNTERIMDASFRQGAPSQLIWHNILSTYFMHIPTHELESWDPIAKSWQNASAKIAYGKEFTLAESYLFETRDQSVWLNSPLGMARKQNGQWQTFAQSPRLLVKPNGFIETQQGVIYAGDAAKVWMFQDKDWVDVSAEFPFPAEQFAEDKNGTLWIASHYSPEAPGRLAYREPMGSWITVDQPWHPGTHNNSIAHIGVTEQGELFVVGRSRNYAIKNATGWQVYVTDSWTSFPLYFPEFVPGRYIRGNLSLHDSTENDKNRFQVYRNQLIVTRSGFGVYVADGKPIESPAP
jgi:hypothetical protein